MTNLIDPKRIRVDLDTQSRVAVNEDVVRDYMEAMSSGVKFPPILVFYDEPNDQYILADGFHRYEAHVRLKADEKILVEQQVGTIDDARWASIGANKSHGLQRSNEDKRNAVKQALLHPNGIKLSNVKIAKHVGVNDKTVAAIRKELELSSEIPKIENRTIQRGDQIYKQNANYIRQNQTHSKNLSSEIPMMQDRQDSVQSKNLSSEIPMIDNPSPSPTCSRCRYYADKCICELDGSEKLPWDSSCDEFAVRVDEKTHDSIPTPDYDNVELCDVDSNNRNGFNPHPKRKIKNCIAVYLPSDNPQLFAVELRDHYEREYLEQCLVELKYLLDDDTKA
jgi:ParB-like chromosome segregation protein Spo0J